MVDEATMPEPDAALVAEFQLYDRAVDVVSAFHWFFTATKEMPDVVSHFERYPNAIVQLPDGPRIVTPDFTVLFKDGTGLVAEIANIARHESSVDKLCSQLLNYSQIQELPGPDGTPVPISSVDVLFLSPMKTAADAARRVFADRMDDPEHSYKPAKAPVLMQFAQQPDEYVFQPWPDKSRNGVLTSHGESQLTAMEFTSLTIKPAFFAANKVQYAFCNDPIPPLYLATRLVVSVFPEVQAEPGKSFETSTAELVALLQHQYGQGRVSDVTRAMTLLKTAGLATSKDGKTWKVRSGSGTLGREDVHVSIATRVAKGASPRPKRSKRAASDDAPLFDDDEQLEKMLQARGR